jgi:hypothetical protein
MGRSRIAIELVPVAVAEKVLAEELEKERTAKRAQASKKKTKSGQM